MHLEVLHAVELDVDAATAVRRGRKRQRVRLLVIVAKELEALLASRRVDDLAGRADIGAAAAARRGLLVRRRVGDLGLDEVRDGRVSRGLGEAAERGVLW
jgi:hypothetical protein